MEEFIPLGAGAGLPKRVKNDNKIFREKAEKRNKFRKEKKKKANIFNQEKELETRNKFRKEKKKKANIFNQKKELEVTDQKPSYRIKLVFRQQCPAIADICKLHPLIKRVSIPKRPPSIRHCYLKLNSPEEVEEVWSFLDKKKIEPFFGVLRCFKPLNETLNEIKISNPELLDEKYMTPVDIKHAKRLYYKKLEATIDVKCNSTERELFLRYGIPFVLKKEKQDGGDAPSIAIDEEQNGRHSPSNSMSEEDDDMNAPKAY